MIRVFGTLYSNRLGLNFVEGLHQPRNQISIAAPNVSRRLRSTLRQPFYDGFSIAHTKQSIAVRYLSLLRSLSHKVIQKTKQRITQPDCLDRFISFTLEKG